MKKKLWIALGTLAALLLVAYFVVAFFLGALVTKGVNHFGPQITQTSVTLASADLSPFSGEGTLNGLVVANPPGWRAVNAFALSKIHVSVVPTSLFSDRVVIKDITIDGPQFDYETRLVSSNLGELLSHVEGSTTQTNATVKTKTGQPIRFEIKHFLLRNGHVRLGAGTAAIDLPMPPIEISNLGMGPEGASAGELAAVVMQAVAKGVISSTTQSAGTIGATLGAAAGAKAKSAAAALQGLFGK